MILLDLNQILFASVTKGNSKDAENEKILRAKIYNSILNYSKKFKSSYGKIVLCCDSNVYWRKTYFPQYKACRKVDRDNSDYDWNKIFTILNQIKRDLMEYFPYTVLEVEGAEADDLIGTLAPRFTQHENVLILSSDNDFVQLQTWNEKRTFKIKQYSMQTKKFIEVNDPALQLKMKILRGDTKDGIPNVLSDDNCFIDKVRQKSITESFLKEYLYKEKSDITDESIRKNFERNELLIDLTKIPNELKYSIVQKFEITPIKGSKTTLLSHLLNHKLMNFVENLGDF